MANERMIRYSSVALTVALAAAIPLAGHAATAARVDFATADVKALSPDGRSRPLAKGAEIASGETIDTGSGRAQVRFSDGAQVSLAPQTQFRIDDYRFSGQADGSEKGFFSLLKGGLRTITGLVGRTNRDNYKVNTTVATIGIRGTEYSVTYGNSINVTTGEGSVEVCNAAGCLILNSGETGYVPDANTRPAMTDKKAEIPPPPPDPVAVNISGNDTDKEGNPAALIELGEPAMPIVPFASGLGTLAAAYTKLSYSGLDAGILGGTINFGASSELASFADCCGGPSFTSGTLAESGTDGLIAWGRWASGNVSGNPLASMAYAAGFSGNAVVVPSIVRGYTSFASTAPVATSGGYVSATGAPNSVTGTLNVNFSNVSGSGGTLSYVLNVPISGQTFTINGAAQQYSSAGFLGTSSTITSSGSGCMSSCTGIIPYGDAIQGFFTGNAGQRAGANYGFTSSLGNVSGAIVFK
ncbi:MAG: hypothetical protein HKUEN07_35510 [Rhodocyclaceae bacterium]|uniref:FecR domain-containing protein n=1 Tax=Candidatus Desulfobacillus denitrificans TaxID=2608985 RepID=A0A809RU54_9PROT|nr:FecR domain-containing protein [Rhodocyclaceae bacterium]BBO19726.1 FecR domain-containing protein [Candidatus Desulfobacillus denitrificans]GIK45873.1 MAG: hypothetical protein BroJett012_17760 [Betaproteobacteria bacterium]GJQ56982.1 MAG: hypothetical protein HKUEN07_35510 [Rhodocyclaceae bacterium]